MPQLGAFIRYVSNRISPIFAQIKKKQSSLKRILSILSVAIAVTSLVGFAVFPHHHHDDGIICLITDECEHDHRHHADDCADHHGACVSSMDYTEPQVDGGLKCRICPCGNPAHDHLAFMPLCLPDGLLDLAEDMRCLRLSGFLPPPLYLADASFVYGLRAPPSYS